jgi:hypothetical protein
MYMRMHARAYACHVLVCMYTYLSMYFRAMCSRRRDRSQRTPDTRFARYFVCVCVSAGVFFLYTYVCVFQNTWQTRQYIWKGSCLMLQTKVPCRKTPNIHAHVLFSCCRVLGMPPTCFMWTYPHICSVFLCTSLCTFVRCFFVYLCAYFFGVSLYMCSFYAWNILIYHT